MVELYIQSAVIIFFYFFFFFLLAQIAGNNSIVDMGWGAGFVLLTLFTMISQGAFTSRSILLALMIIIWGSRLSYHIIRRNWGKPEDFRYVRWRKEWGQWVTLRAFFQVFMLQGFMMLIIASPIILVNASHKAGLNMLDLLGFFIWMIGFYFEAAGDSQLARFKEDPANKGRIIKTGLWRYTRHPNYFGEVTMWWGVFLLAISVPQGWMSVISPLTITWLMLFVSGVPMLEKKYENNAEFQAYARQTNRFLPWFPKNN